MATKLLTERVEVAPTVFVLVQYVAMPVKPVPLTLLAPAVAEIVIGELPIIVKAVQLASPVQVAVVVGNVPSRPPEPTYTPPCVREGSLTADEKVDDAVEKSPFKKLTVVVVETPYVCASKGHANVLYPASFVN